jgi:hypothetical protein
MIPVIIRGRVDLVSSLNKKIQIPIKAIEPKQYGSNENMFDNMTKKPTTNKK